MKLKKLNEIMDLEFKIKDNMKIQIEQLKEKLKDSEEKYKQSKKLLKYFSQSKLIKKDN